MIHFHFCKTYLDKVSPEADKLIRKKINSLKNRLNLKGVNAITSFTGAISVLTISSPYTRVLLQEDSTIADGFIVFFIREISSQQGSLSNYIQVRDGNWSKNHPIQTEEIEKCKSELNFERQSIDNRLHRKEIPHQLINWLSETGINIDFDVYETYEWVKFASDRNKMNIEDIKLYGQILADIEKNIDNQIVNDVIFERSNKKIVKATKGNIGIIYSHVIIGNFIHYILHGGTRLTSKNEFWLRLENLENCYKDDNFGSIEDVRRISMRAYPKNVLNDADFDLWLKIQNSETGNLSLLTEQTEFLKDFEFPKYINGQAGSGKSTMLYYLFAHIYYLKSMGDIEGNIVFLSENEVLIKKTIESIKNLLLSNENFKYLTTEHIKNIDSHFTTFKSFLLSLLVEDSEKVEFENKEYLDFALFSQKYLNSNISNTTKKNYTPEFVWFVINTYIYGYNLSFQITSENYEDKMPSVGKNLITIDDLIKIERDVLPFFKKLSETHWTKNDIIKFIKLNYTSFSQYEVIFCDEAQDFNKVELKFILGLSEYTNYDLSKSNILQVPILLAGDELQTVSPTGFSSTEVRSMLYDELKSAGFNQVNDIEYFPDYNYRSSQQIIDIANAIQYYRKKEFNANIEKPQKAKRPKQEIYLNIFLEYEDLSDNLLQKKLEYKTFIIPINANEDEKESYLTEHTFLRPFQSMLKTAIETKGVDYTQVAICGFGEYFIKHYGSFEDIVDNYSCRFFLNKLYVAVTRARNELLIIDKSGSFEKFWQPLLEYYLDSDWRFTSATTVEDIICKGEGTTNIIASKREDALENAKNDKEKGWLLRNPQILKIAANQFLKLGENTEYYECLGKKEELEEKWEAAAKYYLNKDVGEQGLEWAANAYWKGKKLEKVLDLKSLNSNKQLLRLIIAKLINKNELSEKGIKQLDSYSSDFIKLINDISWRQDIIEKLIQFAKEAENLDLVRDLANLLKDIAKNSDATLLRSLGALFLKVKKYKDSIECFERINDLENPNYINAQLSLAERNDDFANLVYWKGFLHEINNTVGTEKEILQIYKENVKEIEASSNPYVLLYVYQAYLLWEPNSKQTQKLGISIETLFNESGTNDILEKFYFKLLETKSLNHEIIDFVIERWVKKASQVKINIDSINANYKVIAGINNIRYDLFIEEEVNQILEVPNNLDKPLPDKFENITINNFRRFHDLKIENLGLFNLVVGDNNVGKTSFLEALLFTTDKEEYLKRLAFAYIERKNIQPDKQLTSNNQYYYFQLDDKFLLDYLNTKYINAPISFSFTEKRNTLVYNVLFDENKQSANDTKSLIFDNKTLLNHIPYLEGIKQPFISYGKGFGIDLAEVYLQEIQSKPQVEVEFISSMELFIKGIDRIITNPKNGNIDIRIKDHLDGNIPLHQFGEGANKLFRILVQLTLFKGRKVLIDEIDAGIHYTRFKLFWEIILKVAKKNGTQIIVTTHNDECIDYFVETLEKLGKDYQNDARVVQFKNIGEQLKVYSYDYENFHYAVEESIELRGGNRL